MFQQQSDLAAAELAKNQSVCLSKLSSVYFCVRRLKIKMNFQQEQFVTQIILQV